MDLPINLNRPPIDEYPIYQEVLSDFSEDLSEIEILKLFIKYTYHMYVDDYATIQRIKINMQDNYANHILPNIMKLLHSTLDKSTDVASLMKYRRERVELLNDLLSPLSKTRFNNTFYKKISREDPWGKDSVLNNIPVQDDAPSALVTFVGVVRTINDGGPSSLGGKGIAHAD